MQRPVTGIGLYKGDLLCCAVDGRGRGEDEVAHPRGPRGIHQVLRGVVVGFYVQFGEFYGVAHPGQGGQMGDRVELLCLEQGKHPRPVTDVRFYHAEGGQAVQARFVGPLAARIVVIVKVVQAGDGVALPRQFLGQIAADEAGRSGDKDFHGCLS